MTKLRNYLIAFGGVFALVMAQVPPTNARRSADWSAPINLGPIINSESSDQHPAISKDGRSLYFASNRPGGFGGLDIYVSQRASVHYHWGSPVNLGPTVNTAVDEGNPAFSRDGHLMFFQSVRPGGLGGIDMWVSRRNNSHDDFAWQPAVNLGAGVNSADGDQAPSYFENDEDGESGAGGVPQLFFASNRPGGPGGLDIYMSEQSPAGCFGPAVLVTALSSPGGDSRPSIRHDGLEIFFQSTRVGSLGLSNDLWVATRESTLDPWTTPVNLGATINTVLAEQNPYISSDGKTLFFSSDRPGGSGGLDLYMTIRRRVREHSGHDPDDDHDDN